MAPKSSGVGTGLAVLGGAVLVYGLLSKKTSRPGKTLAGYGWYEPGVFPAWWPGRGDGCDDCDDVVRRWGWIPGPRWDWSSTARRWGWGGGACAPSAFVGAPSDWETAAVHWYSPASDSEFYDRVDALRKAGATCSDDRIARCSWRGASFAVVHDVEGAIRCHITSEGGLARPAIWGMIDPVLYRKA
jgi:hypothetical protein